jgi:Cys-tRNA(Pro)/Cys-tRNA(Cys) deacylase
MQKTNSMRILDAQKVPYRVHEFSPDVRSAEDAAEVMGVPSGQVYKTLVVKRERGRPLLVMVGGDQALDLKALAKAIGEKKLSMATHKEAEAITGLQVGGISAIFADDAILSCPEVHVSAGTRGTNVSLAPADLLRLTKARLLRVAKQPAAGDGD